MSQTNLNEMTVIELRKLAKELHVPLRAGISKQGIIERLQEEISGEKPTAAPQETPAEADAQPAQEPAAPEKPAPVEPVPAQGFRQNAAPAAPRFNTKPAYQAPAFANRSGVPRPTESQRTQTTRPVGFTPRFGPAAQEPAPMPVRPQENIVTREDDRPARAEAPRPAYQAEARPAYQAEPRPAYQAERRPAFGDAPRYPQRPAAEAPARPAAEPRPVPSAAEMLSPADCPEGSGVLEMHPEGYGFLRTDSLLPTAKDIFVAASQVRRFGLRAGDHVVGRIRPMRDGDKYAAMLYLSSVNGVAPDALQSRPAFEELTAIYPKRRIRLSSGEDQTPDDLRLMELIAPIGFGQRGLIVCPTGTDKRSLMVHLANAIHRNHPDAHLNVLLFNERPEEITEFREQVTCPVLTSTFDMPPEHHLRLADLALESAARMAEMKQDVILLVDSLTALSRIFTSAAMQQGRQLPGSLNPASLAKAKRLFGYARCLREGGSLTVIAVMNNDPSSKLDEAIINDFRSVANMELLLDASLEKKGVRPAIDLNFSGTRRAEGIQSPDEQDSLKLIRSVLREVPTEKAIPSLLRMLDAAGSSEELLARIRAWVDAVQ